MIISRLMRRLAAALLLALLATSPALLPLVPARATVNSTVSKTIVLGDGITTTFNFSFIGVAAQYISVILTDSSGNETVLTQGSGTTQYQITLNAPVTGAIWGLGGAITYNPSGTPIPSGSTLTIFRTLPLTQAISLQNQNSLSRLGNGAETGLDIGVMQTQQQVETLNRAIVAPIVDATPPAPLPPIAQRANQGAAFDSQGNLVAGQTPAGGVISSAMQPVVNAATLAIARAAMGLGNMAVENIGCGLVDDGAGSARLKFAVSQVATNQAIHTANCFASYITTGPITFTLDRSNTLFNGFGFWIYNTSAGAVTLTPNANDTFQGYASGGSVNIPPNTQAYISTDAATLGNWTVQYALATAPPMVTAGFSNLAIKNNAGTPNTQVDVTADSLTIPNLLAGGVRHTAVSFTINTANVGLNGMDVGTLPASSWVYVWAISNGSTVGGLVSTSSTSPTMPAGYVYRQRLGAMRTDGSSNFYRTLQRGARAKYVVTPTTNTATPRAIVNQASAIGNVTSGTFVAFAVSTFVPPTASVISLQVMSLSTVSGPSLIALVAPNNNYGGYGSTNAMPPITTVSDISSNQQFNQGLLSDLMLESTNIYVASSGGVNLVIAAAGWTDNL